MSDDWQSRIPPVVMVNEQFASTVAWAPLCEVPEKDFGPLANYLEAECGWRRSGASPLSLEKQLACSASRIRVRVDFRKRTIMLDGSVSKSIPEEGAKAEREALKRKLEKDVTRTQVEIQRDLNAALEEITTDIESADRYAICVDWKSVLGTHPTEKASEIGVRCGWAVSGENGRVLEKPLGEDGRLKLDLARKIAMIEAARRKRIYVKDRAARKESLDEQIFDTVEKLKDSALEELGTLKQQIYKEVLLEFARSKGECKVKETQNGDETLITIEVMQ